MNKYFFVKVIISDNEAHLPFSKENNDVKNNLSTFHLSAMENVSNNERL